MQSQSQAKNNHTVVCKTPVPAHGWYPLVMTSASQSLNVWTHVIQAVAVMKDPFTVNIAA